MLNFFSNLTKVNPLKANDGFDDNDNESDYELEPLTAPTTIYGKIQYFLETNDYVLYVYDSLSIENLKAVTIWFLDIASFNVPIRVSILNKK